MILRKQDEVKIMCQNLRVLWWESMCKKCFFFAFFAAEFKQKWWHAGYSFKKQRFFCEQKSKQITLVILINKIKCLVRRAIVDLPPQKCPVFYTNTRNDSSKLFHEKEFVLYFIHNAVLINNKKVISCLIMCHLLSGIKCFHKSFFFLAKVRNVKIDIA